MDLLSFPLSLECFNSGPWLLPMSYLCCYYCFVADGMMMELFVLLVTAIDDDFVSSMTKKRSYVVRVYILPVLNVHTICCLNRSSQSRFRVS